MGLILKLLSPLKECYPKVFDMKDLGVADVILRIKITRTRDEICLSQSHYVDKMIEWFKDHEIKENTNFFLPHTHLRKNTGTGVR